MAYKKNESKHLLNFQKPVQGWVWVIKGTTNLCPCEKGVFIDIATANASMAEMSYLNKDSFELIPAHRIYGYSYKICATNGGRNVGIRESIVLRSEAIPFRKAVEEYMEEFEAEQKDLEVDVGIYQRKLKQAEEDLKKAKEAETKVAKQIGAWLVKERRKHGMYGTK